MAMMDCPRTDRTVVTVLTDKEEIGSVGATGMHSRFFENVIAEVMECCGTYSEMKLRRTLAASKMLSSDVSAAFDPDRKSTRLNSSHLKLSRMPSSA